MRLSTDVRNGNLQQAGDRLDDGFVVFYDGVQPATPDTPLSGNTLIVTCSLSDPAMGTPSGGVRAFNTVGDGTVAASGTPTFARFYRADGNTAVADMSVPGEITLTKSAWTLGEPFPGPAITWSQGVGS